MATIITARVKDRVAKRLAKASKEQEKSKSQLVEWALEQFLFDPDEGLELRPEVVMRLQKPLNRRRFISEEEFWAKVLKENG
ncbi:MAG: hypothetical protein AAB209_06095 [Bacteroidota bacterium]